MSCLVIGEALVDIIQSHDGTLSRHPGGSMLNVAIGLRKLGRTVRLVTDFGLDNDGDLLAEYAASNGLELWLRADAERTNPTSAARVDLHEDGTLSYDFDFTWDIQDTPTSAACKLDLEVLAPQCVAFGSFSTHIAPGAFKVRHWIEQLRENATIFYDPNIREALINDLSETRRIVDSSVALSDIVKASVTDLRTLYGQLVDPAQVARRWLSLGPALVIITRGSDGADVYSARGGVFNQPAPHVAPVDTVGAGAAFFAALIDGITRISMDGAHNREYLRDISDASLHTLIAYASTAAAVTVSRAGASLPTRAELIDHHEFYQTSGMTGMLRR